VGRDGPAVGVEVGFETGQGGALIGLRLADALERGGLARQDLAVRAGEGGRVVGGAAGEGGLVGRGVSRSHSLLRGALEGQTANHRVARGVEAGLGGSGDDLEGQGAVALGALRGGLGAVELGLEQPLGRGGHAVDAGLESRGLAVDLGADASGGLLQVGGARGTKSPPEQGDDTDHQRGDHQSQDDPLEGPTLGRGHGGGGDGAQVDGGHVDAPEVQRHHGLRGGGGGGGGGVELLSKLDDVAELLRTELCHLFSPCL